MSIGDHIDNNLVMQTWFENCVSSHSKCHQVQRGFVPSRLLRLNCPDGKIRLITSEMLAETRYSTKYMTLSHCWGRGTRLITTSRQTLESRMAGISYDDLPRTFRDAVAITRNLGVDFLWIDSLCIIQNDEADWAKESALMSAIYGGSYCTLAALSSSDGEGGCRQVPDIQRSTGKCVDIHFQDQRGDKHRRRFVELGDTRWRTEYDGTYRGAPKMEQSPLRYRAWTLQESALSRRAIYFGTNQMLWKCREHAATAHEPWLNVEDSVHQSLDEADLGSGRIDAVPEHWWDLVEDFVQRQLTFESDKLPALSGLARDFQALYVGSRYYAGLWSQFLPGMLLWGTPDVEARRHSSYVAPTWSWASLNLSDIERVHHLHRDYNAVSHEHDPTVAMASTTLKYEDPYGAITDGFIVLSNASVVQATLVAPEYGVKDRYIEKDSVEYGNCILDVVEDARVGEEVFLLRIADRLGLDSADGRSSGLLLRRVPGRDDWFQRTGLIKLMENSLFDGCVPATITLV
jgi:hypothetical protein